MDQAGPSRTQPQRRIQGRPQCLQPSVVLWFPWILDVHKTSCQLPACHVGEAPRDERLSESEVGWWGPAQLPVSPLVCCYLECFARPGRETQTANLGLSGDRVVDRIPQGVSQDPPRSSKFAPFTLSLFALGLPGGIEHACTQGRACALSRHFQHTCVLGETEVWTEVWGVRTAQGVLFLLWALSARKNFWAGTELLLSISEGNLIFLEDLAGPPIAGGGRAWSPSAVGLAL